MTLKSRWSRASERFLGAFVRQPENARGRAWTIIAGFVLVIGVIDYLTGINISLAALYLIPVSLATGWFGAAVGVRVSLVCTVVRILSDGLAVLPAPPPLFIWWNVSASLLITLFVVWLLDSLLGLHRRLEGKVLTRTRELEASVAERQRLEREILHVSERERGALGRELHDELGQHFVATALAAQVLAENLRAAPEAGQARAIVRWIEEGIAKTRKLARGLLIAHIEPQRLAQELEELAVASSQGAVRCRVHVTGPAIAADADECAQLFRIAQEAVANALRHARATTVQISLVQDEHALTLTIADNGAGLPARREAREGMGLRIMEHRATIIGAVFSLASVPAHGTTVSCRLVHKPAMST